MKDKKENSQPDFTKLAIISVLGVVILGGTVYAAYLYSQRQMGNIVLPGGITYLGPGPQATATPIPAPPAPTRFTIPADETWKVHSGRTFPYSFSYPSTLPLVLFIGDTTDTIAIAWGDIPPQRNILLNIEYVDADDPKYLKLPKSEYVKDWYKKYSGLKGVAKIEPFTNTNGLRGYKAWYLNYADTTPNIDVFFEVPKEPRLVIHLANGILDSTIFDRILDSLKWTRTASTPRATPQT